MSELRQLEGRSAIVTGGAQGIGAAIGVELSKAGASVLIFDQSAKTTQAVVDKINGAGGNATGFVGDITKSTDIAGAITEATSRFGSLDVLVNNAAPARDRAFIGKLADADWDIHAKVVLTGAVKLVEAGLPHLSRSGRGSVINVSSIVAFGAAPEQCSWAYHVSKAGLDQLTRYLASVVGRSNVRVNGVAPGLVDRDSGTKLTSNPRHRDIVEQVVPLGRAASGKEIADAVVFLASDLSSYITGQVLVVDGGLSVQEVFGAGLRTYNKALPPA